MKEIIIKFTDIDFINQIIESGIVLSEEDASYFKELHNSVQVLIPYMPHLIIAEMCFRVANLIINKLNQEYGCNIKKCTKSNYTLY